MIVVDRSAVQYSWWTTYCVTYIALEHIWRGEESCAFLFSSSSSSPSSSNCVCVCVCHTLTASSSILYFLSFLLVFFFLSSRLCHHSFSPLSALSKKLWEDTDLLKKQLCIIQVSKWVSEWVRRSFLLRVCKDCALETVITGIRGVCYICRKGMSLFFFFLL